MVAFSLLAVTLIFGYAVFRAGAGLAEDWYLCSTVMGMVGFTYWIGTPRRKLAPAPARMLAILVAALLAICGLQIVPLPISIVGLVSSVRVELAKTLAPLIGAVQSTTLSIAPAESFRYLVLGSGCMIAFLLAREIGWRSRHRPWMAVAPFVGIAFLEAVLGLVQRYGAGNDLAQGTYVNRNHYAGLLEMTLPFVAMNAIAAWCEEPHPQRRSGGTALKACAWLMVSTTMLVAIVQSLSRMGFVAALAGLFVVGAMWFGKQSGFRTRTLMIAGVAMLVLVAFVVLPTDPLIARFANLTSNEEISSETRVQIWRESWQLIEAYPLTGVGLGGYESGFLRYKTVAPLHLVDFAHNDYLQLLAELGLVGFALLGMLAGRTFWQVYSTASTARAFKDRCLAIGAAGSLGAIALHSLVDFNLYVPAHAMMVAWVAGIVDQLHKRSLLYQRSAQTHELREREVGSERDQQEQERPAGVRFLGYI